jgi:hypothetical protein
LGLCIIFPAKVNNLAEKCFYIPLSDGKKQDKEHEEQEVGIEEDYRSVSQDINLVFNGFGALGTCLSIYQSTDDLADD